MAENSRVRLIVLIRNSFIVTTPGRSTVNVMCADIGITINYIQYYGVIFIGLFKRN